MRDIEVNASPSSTACRRLVLSAAATSLLVAGCSASLPSGSFVSGGVGEMGQHFGDRRAPASGERSQQPLQAAAPVSGGSTQAAASSASGGNRAGAVAPAIAELARAHGTEPRNAEVALAYARALKREGKRREALAVLDTVGEADPRHGQVRLERGLLNLELGQMARAEALLKQSVGGAETDWRAHSALGVAASSQGRQKEAQGHFSRALALSPNNPAVLNNMAVSLLLDRQVDQAEALLRRASAAGTAPQQVRQNLALARGLRADGADGGSVTQQ